MDLRTDAEIAQTSGKAVPNGADRELQRWDAGADAAHGVELETGQTNAGHAAAHERSFRATADASPHPPPQAKVRW